MGGFLWRHAAADRVCPIAVIAPATSVRCRYYARFASFLSEAGFDVLTFDYRGIGESRPINLRGFKAGWVDWGAHDVEAALDFAMRLSPGAPLDIVAHSIGGVALGLAPSAARARRILTVGSQFAHWRDYAPAQRRAMVLRWHVLMPLLARLCGYVPARRLGWMEDTPAGVARDWSCMGPCFEESVSPGPLGKIDILQRFAAIHAPILAIGLDDDPFGTVPAIERLLAYFPAGARTHLRLAPGDLGVEEIGHFAAFHDRFRSSLWPLMRDWLLAGTLAGAHPGRILPLPDQVAEKR
nr:alpha/beta fold hydrolase [Ancylobacter crimeensis]